MLLRLFERLSCTQILRTAALASALVALASPVFAQTAVLTQHDDNTRSGSYTNEIVLNPTNVAGGNFGKVFTLSLDANVNGQPLYAPNLTINSAVHNAIIAYTSSNNNGSACSLWAFDADTGSTLWQHQFTNSAEWTTCTPVIDPSTDTVYVVTKDTTDSGDTHLRAINLLTGVEKAGSPITISATVSGTGDGNNGNGTLSFDTGQENCRPALLFVNGSVYIAFAHNSDSFPYHGWIFRYTYNGSSFTQNDVYCTDPNGGLGGIWMAGNGLAADGSGNIYANTGNGTFDVSMGSYGMSVLKLSSTLSLLDYFTPFDEAGNSNGDLDFGNCGVMFVPNTTALFSGATKFGSAFLMDSSNLGQFTSGGPDNVLNRIDSVSNGSVGQNPIGWDSGTYKYVYLWPFNSNLEQFRYDPSVSKLNPDGIFQSTSNFTDGGSLAVTSNGTSNAILWAVDSNGAVYAMNPATITQTPYWNSNTDSSRDGLGSTGHFQFPLAANGRVYVPTGSSSIAVYGLLTKASTPQISPATETFSGSVPVTITDSTSGSAIYYTTDGSTPYPGQGTTTAYSSSFNVTSTTTVKAIAFSSNSEPSAVSSVTYTLAADAATNFLITAPASVTAGVPFNVIVTARTQSNQTATTYSGTVHFGTNAPRATLPANSTLTNGTGTFSVTFTDPGTASANFKIEVADTVNTNIQAGLTSAITVVAGPATGFGVTIPTSVQAGIPFNITVAAMDKDGNKTTNYAGTVHFTSTDGAAVLPANGTLTNGTGTFAVTLKTGGSQTVTATDTVSSSITGTSSATTVLAAVALLVQAPSSVTAGTPFNYTVTAVDQDNHVAPGCTDTVRFVTNAPRATLPSPGALTAGTGTFSATFTDPGSSSSNFKIEAADSTNTGVKNGLSSAIAVVPGPASSFGISIPKSVEAGIPFNITVTALDKAGNPTTNYSGTVHFSSSDVLAALPANSTLTNGSGTFSVTLETGGSQTITATDTVTSSITGTSAATTVLAAVALVVQAPSSVTAGTPFSFTVTAIDQFGNVATGCTDTVRFATNAPRATLPSPGALVNGAGTFSATLTDPGSSSANFKIEAADSTNTGVKNGVSSAIAVTT